MGPTSYIFATKEQLLWNRNIKPQLNNVNTYIEHVEVIYVSIYKCVFIV